MADTDPAPRRRRTARGRLGADAVRRRAPVGRRNAASVVRIESTGRLLMCFSHVVGRGAAQPGRADASATPTTTARRGRSRSPLYAYPGWFCLAMGGLARVADDNVKLMLGRILIDLVPRRHGADDRLVGRLGDDPRRRRHAGPSRRRRSGSSRNGPSCTGPATRIRWPTAASCGRSWGRWAATSAGTPG